MGDGASDALTAPHDDIESGRAALLARAGELGVWDWDLVNDKIVYSPRAKAICGLPPNQPLAIHQVRALMHPDDAAKNIALSGRVLDPSVRETGRYEYRIIRPDGQVRWVVAHGEAEFSVVDGVERAVRYIGTLQDVTDQRRLVEAEQRASERLRLAIEASRMAVWDYDVATGSVNGSPELNRLMGFPENASPTVAEFQAGYLPGEQERMRSDFRAALAAGQTAIETEFRRRGPDGVLRWLMLRAEVELGESGAPLRIVGVVLDITERRLAEEALRESEQRFRIMADSAPSPVWVTSVEGGIEFVNDAFARYTGRPRDALIGNVWIDLLYRDDIPQVIALRTAARGAREPFSFEARFLHVDGSYRWMLASSQPRFDAEGAFQGYVGIAVDMTERRQAQEALKESEHRFRQMAEGAPAMLWVGDETGACVYLNKAQREFWGVADDLSDFSWSTSLLPEDREALFAVFSKAMAAEEAFEVEARYYRADGEVRILMTRALPRRDAAGRFLGMHGVNIDVTDIREAAAKQRLLINELNHRVKNTLASVQSMTRLSLRPGVPVDIGRDTLVDRLMALSKAHDVLTQREWRNASLEAIVEEAVRPFEDPTVRRFVVDGPESLLGPNAALAVAMVLHELGTNAVKYGALSATEGRVLLSWTREGDRVRLTWRETGGPAVSPPSRKGFGTRLLKSGELAGSASLAFETSGLVATFEVKTVQ